MRAGTVVAVVRGLEERGVAYAFGLPGTQNVDLVEALRTSSIRMVQTTSELAASFMAVGYGRAKGEPGVLVTIPGPGFTYALPGLAEARLDSVPLLHLVVQHTSHPGKRFRHQAIPHRAMVQELAKAVIQVDLEGDDSNPEEAVARAWEAALSGEPGPVVLWMGELDPSAGAGAADAPVGSAVLGAGPGPGAMDHRSGGAEGTGAEAGPTAAGGPGVVMDEGQGAGALAERLGRARRPVLFLGQGALGNPEGVAALAEALRAPVFTTPSARGLLPEDHPLSLAFDYDAGGLAVVNELLSASDLVLVLGCKLGHNGTGGFALDLPAERSVQVNTDPAALGTNYPASLLICSDVGPLVDRLLDALGTAAGSDGEGGSGAGGEGRAVAGAGAAGAGGGPAGAAGNLTGRGWAAEEVAEWRQRIADAPPGGPPEPMVAGRNQGSVRDVLSALRQELPRDAIVVTDSGLHQLLVRRHFPVLAPRGLLAPTDFQSMGFGLPAAIGAALACPDRKIVAVIGDGGLAMSGMELVTLAREGLAVTVIVFNDGHLNLIRLQQERDYGHAHVTSVQGPDLELMAEAAGLGFLSLDGDVPGGLRAALASRGPVLVDLPLGDSPRIRSARRNAALKAGLRNALGDSWVERLKGLLRPR